MNVLTIPSRFNGPAGIGNGGHVCGRIVPRPGPAPGQAGEVVVVAGGAS